MKPSVLVVSSFTLIAAWLPASAHPGHAASPVEKAFLVSWIGAAPASGTAKTPATCPDFFKKAFVSIYPILGASKLP